MTEVPIGEQLADKAAIRELIDRFFFGMDTKDPDIMMSAFTSDGVCGGAHGFDEMLDLFSLVRRVGQGRHVAANQIIEVSGDTAHADTNAIAFVVTPEDGRDLVRTRATRYVNDLVRTPAGWRIRACAVSSSRTYRTTRSGSPPPNATEKSGTPAVIENRRRSLPAIGRAPHHRTTRSRPLEAPRKCPARIETSRDSSVARSSRSVSHRARPSSRPSAESDGTP